RVGRHGGEGAADVPSARAVVLQDGRREVDGDQLVLPLDRVQVDADLVPVVPGDLPAADDLVGGKAGRRGGGSGGLARRGLGRRTGWGSLPELTARRKHDRSR